MHVRMHMHLVACATCASSARICAQNPALRHELTFEMGQVNKNVDHSCENDSWHIHCQS